MLFLDHGDMVTYANMIDTKVEKLIYRRTSKMNVTHHAHRVLAAPPVALQVAFRNIDPTQRGQWLFCDTVAFTRVETQFMRDFVQSHPRCIVRVNLHCCSFPDSDYNAVLDLLQDSFDAMVVVTFEN
jgi:hypothetical protein